MSAHGEPRIHVDPDAPPPTPVAPAVRRRIFGLFRPYRRRLAAVIGLIVGSPPASAPSRRSSCAPSSTGRSPATTTAS